MELMIIDEPDMISLYIFRSNTVADFDEILSTAITHKFSGDAKIIRVTTVLELKPTVQKKDILPGIGLNINAT